MTTGLTLHCETPIFSTYQHCPDCGQKLDAVPKISNAQQLKPDLLDPIKPYYQDAKTFTGVVLETHLYKRSKVVNSRSAKHSTSETIEQAFNFITIEDELGETIKINIDGSDQAANKVHVGDAITIFEPSNLVITVAPPSGISHLLNNRLADTFIVHNQDGTRYSRQNQSEQFTPKAPSKVEALVFSTMTFLTTGFFLFLLLWIGPNIPEINNIAPWLDAKNAPQMALTFAIFVAFLGYNYDYKNAKKHDRTVTAYDDVVTSIRDITFSELGYHHRAPKTADSDIFCYKCDTRCSNQLKYCSDCGSSLQLSSSDSLDVQATSNLTATPLNSGRPSSIKEKRLALMKQYQCDTPTENFAYNKFLGTTEHFTCSAKARVYRVLDRSLYAETKSSSSTSYTYTETRNAIGGHVSTEVNSSHTTINTRVDIEGKVLVEDHNGDIEEMEVYPEILGTLDAGDYLFVAHQRIQQGDKESTNYRMIAYNINKNLEVKPYDIRHYQASSFLESTLPFLYFPLSIYIGYHFDSINQLIDKNFHYALPTFSYSIEHWVLGVLSFFALLYMDTPITRPIEKSNQKRAWEIVKPIFDLYDKISAGGIAEKLAKYK